ncbi:MAG TPA: hypothetical protein VLK58_00560 [Conexibacter sp.]|nr:hypothetical protein [Conexibacter sp.]
MLLARLRTRTSWELGLAIALSVIVVVAVQRVLPITPAPRDELLPTLAAAIPAADPHDDRSGYVVALRLTVESCDEPVHGAVMITLPKEFFAEEPVRAAKRALFAVGLMPSGAKIEYVVPYYWSGKRLATDSSWAWTVDESDGDPYEPFGAFSVGATRIDGWSSKATEVQIGFDVDWLSPRGFGTCWLSLPELVGPRQAELSLTTADAVNKRLGRNSGAGLAFNGSGTVTTTTREVGPDGRPRTKIDRDIWGPEYTTGWAVAATGLITVDSNLDVLFDASRTQPNPSGKASWRCRPGSTRVSFSVLDRVPPEEGALRGGAPLSSYELARSDEVCRGWLALASPNADTWRDLWLLSIGAAASIAASLFVDLLLARRRNSTA